MDEDTEDARMASVKLLDGDVHGAIRILSSDSFYVIRWLFRDPDQMTFEQLISKTPKITAMCQDQRHVHAL